MLLLDGIGQQNNNWCFGRHATLDFNAVSGSPVPTIKSGSIIEAKEGSATISDASGKLLFYTDGVNVYNRLHQRMPNGSDIGGDLSACQSALIVPSPGNPDLYYIFTTDAFENDFANGYMYSIVDMSQDNGNGEVVSKRMLLWSSCTERLTAVRHRNGIDVWVITNDNNSNIFRSWLVSCSGIAATPVVSTIGVVMNVQFQSNTGYLKASPDGRQLCQTHFSSIRDVGFVQLFDFDNSTGLLSNAKKIEAPAARLAGCEYSPSSQLLYLTRPFDNAIDQFQARLATATEIESSKITVATGGAFFGIQLAPDEKIYLIKEGRLLSRIEKPDVQGTGCNFVLNALTLDPGSGQMGSPNFINDAAINPLHGFSYTITDSCGGSVQFTGFTNLAGMISWDWDFGDGNTSSQQNPLHIFLNPKQLYNVTLTITPPGCGKIIRLKPVFPFAPENEITFSYKYNCLEGKVYFTNPNTTRAGETFEWDFGDGNTSVNDQPVHSYAAVDDYTVTLKRISPSTCRVNSVTLPVSLVSPSLTVSPDQQILLGQTVTIRGTGDFIKYRWTPHTGIMSPNNASTFAAPATTTTYILTATDANGCIAIDSVKLTVSEPDDIYIPTAFTPNNDGINDFLLPVFPSHISLVDYSIYNRWGQKVFTSKQRGYGWNGRWNNIAQPTGVYTWIFSAKDTNGKGLLRKGTLTLIR